MSSKGNKRTIQVAMIIAGFWHYYCMFEMARDILNWVFRQSDRSVFISYLKNFRFVDKPEFCDARLQRVAGSGVQDICSMKPRFRNANLLITHVFDWCVKLLAVLHISSAQGQSVDLSVEKPIWQSGPIRSHKTIKVASSNSVHRESSQGPVGYRESFQGPVLRGNIQRWDGRKPAWGYAC